jgi:hypothetical protein
VDQVAASAVQTEEPKEDPKAAPATGTEGPKKKGEKPPPADSPAKAEATTSSQGCQEGSSSTPPDLRQDAKPKVEELIKLLQARGQKAAPEKGAKPEV